MPTVRANGLEIHYTTEGAGPPLVMLHGATSTALEDWSAQRPLFRRAFHLYLPDARGHGATRWDVADGFDREMLVQDFAAFVDEVGLETFHLVGFSMGAMTALTYATRHADRLRTLIIAGIDVQREPRARVARRLMDPERVDREEPGWAEQLDRRHGPVQGRGAWRRLLSAIAADVGEQRLLTADELRAVRVPTLMAYGDRDVFVPVDHAVALYRQLPDARLLVAPATDHQVMVTRPGLFNEAAAGFYRATERVARERAGVAAAGTPSGAAVTGGDGSRGAGRAPVSVAIPDLDDSSGDVNLDPARAAARDPDLRDREGDWFDNW